MQLIIKGRHEDLAESVREYAEKKISKIERFFNNFSKIEVEFASEKNPRIADRHGVEVTIFARGAVIRAKEAASDYMSAVDLVMKKVEKQVKKYKEKHHAGTARHHESLADLAPKEAAGSGVAESEEPRIVKTKRFGIKPMTPEEAALQMDLLGHSFFVFTDAQSAETNVIYRRRDGNYGLIEPITSEK